MMMIYVSVINVYLQGLLLRYNLKLDLGGPKNIYVQITSMCRVVSLN